MYPQQRYFKMKLKNSSICRFFVLGPLLIAWGASGQPWNGILSAERSTSDWSNVGAHPTVQFASRVQCGSTITPAMAGANAGTYINTALYNCAAAHTTAPYGYVLLGQGRFTITDTGISITSDNVILRGSGADQTYLMFSGPSVAIGCYTGSTVVCISGTSTHYDYTTNNAQWTAGYSKGTTSITVQTVAGSAALKPIVGTQLILTQLSDTGLADTGDIYHCTTSLCIEGNPGTVAYYTQSQVVTVTSIDGDGTCSGVGCRVGIDPPIRMPNTGNGGWRLSRSPIAWWSGNTGPTSKPRVGVGIEDLTIDASVLKYNERGQYSAATNYSLYDFVGSGGFTFLALRSSTGSTPPVCSASANPCQTADWQRCNGGNDWQCASIIGGPGGLSYVNNGIQLYWVKDSWVTGVRLIRHAMEPVPKAQYNYISVTASLHYTIANNYIFGRLGGDDYAFHPQTSDQGLWQNNIIQNGTNGFLDEGINGSGTGTHGDVVAYNYQPHHFWGLAATDDTYSFSQGTLQHHTGGSSYTLWEGNETHSWQQEIYYGQAFFDIAFRNRLPGWDMGQAAFATLPVYIMTGNRYHSAIGNVMGTSGWHTRYEDSGTWTGSVWDYGTDCQHAIYMLGGNHCWAGTQGSGPFRDPLTIASFMRWGNWDNVTGAAQWNSSEVPTVANLTTAGVSTVYANPVPGSQALPASFYLASKPSWFGSVPFPAIGPDVTGGTLRDWKGGTLGGHAYKIPAHVAADTTPTDSAFGAAFTATSGTWTAGAGGNPNYATITVGTSTAGLIPLHDYITVTGSNTGYNASIAMITGVTANTISYEMPANPGTWSGTASGRAPARLAFNASVSYGSGGGSAPFVSLDSSSHDFGTQMIGVESAGFIFNLQNTGNAVLSISSITPSGDFSASNNCPISPSTLGIGSGCAITAMFTPTQSGTRSGSILVSDEAFGSPQTISLSGTGLAMQVGSIGTGISAGQVIIH